jgi:hypothetical protein
MRRTKASLIYRRTRNLRAVQLLLGHTKLESTVRYLGIEVEDALEMAEQTEDCQPSAPVAAGADRPEADGRAAGSASYRQNVVNCRSGENEE